jgi:hypothetical protein
MKFNVEIEIQWVDGKQNIDEEIKNEIASSISTKLINKNEKDIQDKVSELSKNIEKSISLKINEIIENWLNGSEIILTDNYGNKKKTYSNVMELVKERFDNALTEKVDKNGKSSSYDCNQTRLDYMLSKLSEGQLQRAVENSIEEINKKLKIYVETQMKDKVGEQIFKMAGLELKK